MTLTNIATTSSHYAKNLPLEGQPRVGESQGHSFRSSRFFCVGHQWYFTTREGFNSGPYFSRHRAEVGLQRFLTVVRMLPGYSAN